MGIGLLRKKGSEYKELLVEKAFDQVRENLGKIERGIREDQTYIDGRKDLAKQYRMNGDTENAKKYAIQAASQQNHQNGLKETDAFLQRYIGIVTMPASINLEFGDMIKTVKYLSGEGNKDEEGNQLSELEKEMGKYTKSNEISDYAKNMGTNIAEKNPPAAIMKIADEMLREIDAEIASEKTVAKDLEEKLKSGVKAEAK